MLALTDSLTEILNRRTLEERLEDVRNSLRQEDRHLLLFVDLQGVFEINKDHGWEAGDVMLRHVARRLEVRAGSRGFVGRFSGCHFVLFNPDVPPDSGFDFGVEVARSVETVRPLWHGLRLQVAVWVGVVPIQRGCPSATDLLFNGMLAAHEAKATGTCNVHAVTEYRT